MAVAALAHPHRYRYVPRPEAQWGPGHRGIDLLGTVGQRVLAIGDGTVSFAGMVAGRGVVVLDHGRLRSTYEPVTPQVRRGDQVTGGQVIATLAAVQSHCPPAACLHLGVRRGDVYLDPLSLLGAQQVRLKPLGGLDPAFATTDPGNGVTAGQSVRPAPTSAHVDPPAGIDVPASAAGGTAAGIAVALLVRRRRRARHRVSSPAA